MSASRPKPVSYLYLDGAGIEALLAQVVDRQELECGTTVERSGSGRVGVTGRLRNFILTAVGGPELDLSAEIGGSWKKTLSRREVQASEQKLAEIVATLEAIGKPTLFTDLGEATRTADLGKDSVFVKIRERFDAPQFQSGGDVSSVNSDGYLLLELGGGSYHHYGDDYFKRPTRVVTLSASLLKMPASTRGMGASGHDARFFRGFSGRGIPLGVFGVLTATPSYFQIKPYAIWR
ncbi:MAG TPA: hypothetical protein PLZ95_00220 [Bryobacteraceae bacterium]|nr:hypothetical protein [Bryobacteraceae bacterium]